MEADVSNWHACHGVQDIICSVDANSHTFMKVAELMKLLKECQEVLVDVLHGWWVGQTVGNKSKVSHPPQLLLT